jgi:tetratricopeptide (TPR) repeat protein
MNLRCFLLTLFAVVFAPGLLRAQSPSPSVEMKFVVQNVSLTEKMYEDIEIMRRILDRKLHGLYPSHIYQTFGMVGMQGGGDGLGGIGGMRGMQSGMGMAGGMMPVTVPLRSLEGVYLKGQGVVYTATLKSLQRPAKAEADSAKDLLMAIGQRDSEWDSIRRQVRNEKEKPKKPEESKPPSLSDVLLKVLAENGHHFSQLGENESLTIVLTVHEESPSSPAAKSGTGSTKAKSKSTPSGSDADTEREVRNLWMLGHLHMKQEKYNEAILAFQRYLELATRPQQAAPVHRRLAECYLMQGKDTEAQAELERAVALTKKETEAREKPAANPAAALPVKLIISAPKKLLDQVKAGKISFEDFRRQASVEMLRFGDRRSRE